MAQELPYFRFCVQEWQNGNISIERFELQGLFISICGFYWLQDCNVTLTLLKKKFFNAEKLIDELIKLRIIKHEKKHDKINIDFLFRQYVLLNEKRQINKINGLKGSEAKARLKRNGSYKDKDKDKDKDKEKIFFNEKLKLEFEYFENEITPRYGNQHQRLMGGLSSKAIKELCNENGIEYTEGEENNA